MNFLEHAEKLVKISSISEEGNEEIALYLQSLMDTMGFKTVLQEVTHSIENVSKRQFNIVGFLGDTLVDSKTKKGLLLSTHLDTADPGLYKNWNKTHGDPLEFSVEDEFVFGLGAADAKLDILCKLKACERYSSRNLKMPIYLAGTAGKEIGMIGARYLVKSKIINPKYILVGAPTGLTLGAESKAHCTYLVRVAFHQLEKDAKGFNIRILLKCFGRTAPADMPELGINAIEQLFVMIKKIKDAGFIIKFNKISGGNSINKIPDSAQAEFYISTNSFEDFRKFYEKELQEEKVEIEFGGLGESSVKFLPDYVFSSIDSIFVGLENVKKEILFNSDKNFHPAQSTVSLNKLHNNQGFLDFNFDVRLIPSVSLEEFEKKLQEEIASINMKYASLDIRYKKINSNLAVKNDLDSELLKSSLEIQESIAGMEKKLGYLSVSTEVAQYKALGFDAVAFGPGHSIEKLYAPNECNIIDHLDKAVHFYDRVIERFCL